MPACIRFDARSTRPVTSMAFGPIGCCRSLGLSSSTRLLEAHAIRVDEVYLNFFQSVDMMCVARVDLGDAASDSLLLSLLSGL